MRSVKRTLAASTLTFEAFAVFFGGLVAKDLSSLTTGQALLLFSWLALLCLLCAGLLRSQVGYWLGSVLQVAVVATGYWVTEMYVIGGLFALIWLMAIVSGGRADRISREREAAEAAEAAEATGAGAPDEEPV